MTVKNILKKIVLPVFMIVFLAGCTKDNNIGSDIKITPNPTTELAATVAPTAAPTAVPTPAGADVNTESGTDIAAQGDSTELSIRDVFTKTDVSGEYEYIIEDMKNESMCVYRVGDCAVMTIADENWNYRLVSYNLLTGEMISRSLSDMSPYLSYINDEVFGLTDYVNAMAYIYDTKLIRRAEYYKGDIYEDVTYSPDGQNIYILHDGGELEQVDIVNRMSRIVVKNKKLDEGYISGFSSTGKVIITRYDYYTGETKIWHVDPVDGTVTGYDDFTYYEDYSDGERTVFCTNGDHYAIDVYDCAIEDILSETVTKSALSIKIDNINEAIGPMVDWEHNCLLTKVNYYDEEGSIYECKCRSLETGELISSYVFKLESGSNIWPSFALDGDEGLMYVYQNRREDIRIVAWDYLNDEDNDESESFPKYGIIPKELEQKRAEFEKKHNMYLYLGSEVFTSPFDYRLSICEDWKRTSETIDKLDEVLDLYPDGFFEQLKYDGIKTLGIYLCGGFTKMNDYSIDNAIALATYFGYERALAIDMNYGYDLERTIVHEVSHWIDNRIISEENFSEHDSFDDAWCALNPSDFSYMYSYVSGRYKYKYVFSENDLDNAYFVDDYSQTYPTEDRARVFEHLMFPNRPYDENGTIPENDDDYEYYGTEYMKSQHLRDKAAMYFKAIREAFDCSGWPEETTWEQRLREINTMYTE